MDLPWRRHAQQPAETRRGPRHGVVMYTVSGLHPHQSKADAPRQPGLFDRKAWSHLGFCCDVELGIDASNLVYNMTWAAL
eukprot:8610419-Pyramimonas_sp.AAC.1